jgi:hypothetical protein
LGRPAHAQVRRSSFSGDFTFGCDPGGFEIARHFVTEIKELGDSGIVLLIPGNHDINIGKDAARFGKLSLPTRKEQAEELYRSFRD